MGSISNISEINPQPTNDLPASERRRSSVVILKRLFSTDSITNSAKYTYDLYPPSNYGYSLCGKEFLLKITEILVSVICAGLYTDGVQQSLEYSISSVLFPNVVFSSCIINTSVMALGYALGQVMPEVLMRSFNAIAAILFFVSTCITGATWFAIVRSAEDVDPLSEGLLLAETFTSFLNVVLYSVDLGISIRKSFRGMISLGIYSTGIRMVPCDKLKHRNGTLESRMTSMMFPNIVFSAFSIITSVIALSYILKQTMSAVLIRIFNAIGAILYFVSGCVTGYMWYLQSTIDIKEDEFVPYVMFCSQVITTFINSLLYGLDVGLSLRKSWNINY